MGRRPHALEGNTWRRSYRRCRQPPDRVARNGPLGPSCRGWWDPRSATTVPRRPDLEILRCPTTPSYRTRWASSSAAAAGPSLGRSRWSSRSASSTGPAGRGPSARPATTRSSCVPPQAPIAGGGPERTAYVSLAAPVNMAGGQPVSMANARAVSELCQRHGIRLFLDATRVVENAFFIEEREPGFAGRSVASIVHEFCSHADGAWMSAKKDGLVNIGGWVPADDRERFEGRGNPVGGFEGPPPSRGPAGRDME